MEDFNKNKHTSVIEESEGQYVEFLYTENSIYNDRSRFIVS